MQEYRHVYLLFSTSPSYGEKEMATGDLIKVMTDGFLKMSNLQRVQFLSFLLSMYLCYDIGVDGNFVPTDFVKLAACSFKHLQAAGIGNTVYFLVQSIGTLRSDGNGPRIPLDRMPFGLLRHNLEFFAKENPSYHYAEWQTTFAHFGHKCDRLFRGPMWSYDGATAEEEDDKSSTGDPATSHVKAGVSNEDLLSQAVNMTEVLAELITGVDDDVSCEDAALCPEFSSLWSGLSTSDKVDLEQASVLPRDIEKLHNVINLFKVGGIGSGRPISRARGS